MKKETWLTKAAKIVESVENCLGEGIIEVTSNSRIWVTWLNIDLGVGHCFDGLLFVMTGNDDALKTAKALKKNLQWKSIIIEKVTK